MSRIRCACCGRIYDSGDELDRVEESRGEFWGAPCFETMYYCWCGSEELEDYDGDEESTGAPDDPWYDAEVEERYIATMMGW